MQVDRNWNTDIVSFEEYPKGLIVSITGDVNLSNVKNVKHNENILLAGDADFNLKSGGTLTLYVQEDGKLRELSRTTGPVVISSTDATYSTATLDANLGTVFVKSGSGALTINNIINGVEPDFCSHWSRGIYMYGIRIEISDYVAVYFYLTFDCPQ
jgi:hypothetical protein